MSLFRKYNFILFFPPKYKLLHLNYVESMTRKLIQPVRFISVAATERHIVEVTFYVVS